MLKLGMKGNEVKLLQEKLGLVADGDFGPKTEKSLKDLQGQKDQLFHRIYMIDSKIQNMRREINELESLK